MAIRLATHSDANLEAKYVQSFVTWFASTV
jgi:hypothetical protein